MKERDVVLLVQAKVRGEPTDVRGRLKGLDIAANFVSRDNAVSYRSGQILSVLEKSSAFGLMHDLLSKHTAERTELTLTHPAHPDQFFKLVSSTKGLSLQSDDGEVLWRSWAGNETKSHSVRLNPISAADVVSAGVRLEGLPWGKITQ